MKVTLKTESNSKIPPIKEFRKLFNSGLKEAKEFVEDLMDSPNKTLEIPNEIIGSISSDDEINNSVYFCIYNSKEDILEEILELSKKSIDMGCYDIVHKLINILEENS